MEEKDFAIKILLYADHLFRLAKLIFYSKEWAEDVLQDLFLKLFDKDTKWKEKENP